MYDPASTSICNRLLPALIMSELCGDTAIMGAFDISDAYLQVDQPTPKKICIIDRPDANYIIHRCLPGQRDGARRWCDHFSSFVQADLGREICAEVPSLFKLPDDKGVLFAHVDDVLFAINEQYFSLVMTVAFHHLLYLVLGLSLSQFMQYIKSMMLSHHHLFLELGLSLSQFMQYIYLYFIRSVMLSFICFICVRSFTYSVYAVLLQYISSGL